ncbi:MAG: hypothetical protein Q7R30_00070 [Acidobacteriota bacterium]|nr:hypothetical protein [Acidobacteriota bacterium]
MAADRPKITVITLAFRPGGFDVVSKALAAQQMPDDLSLDIDVEWIVVDELWRWRSVACGEQLAALPFSVKHYPTERPLFPVASTMRAGNTAIRHAVGELIVYCCDYASPPPDFLAKHWAAYQANPKAFGVSTYRMREVTGWCPSVRAIDAYEACIAGTFPPQRLWSNFDAEPVMQPPTHLHTPGALDNWCAHYKVDSVPRAALNEVNGWDEEYDGVYAYGDVDMTMRLRLAGWNPQPVDVTVDIFDAHRSVLRLPESSYRDYDAPRLLARCTEDVAKGKYRCDFGLVMTPAGHKRTLAYHSKHGLIFSGVVDDVGRGKIITLNNRPWLGRPMMFMSPVDCFVWQFVKPPMLVLCEDTMRMKEASEDAASTFAVDFAAHEDEEKYGAVIFDASYRWFERAAAKLKPDGHLVYKGDHDGGNALIDWALPLGWSTCGEEFGEELCGVVAKKPAAVKETTP